MIVYLTYNDAPSGIFTSQVIDVVRFVEQSLHKKVRLVAFVSVRGFLLNRKIIKDQLPNAIVLPMYPKMINWQRNSMLLSLLCLMLKPETIIGRSVLATKLALMMREKKLCKKVIYDGRGAIASEWKEYKVVEDRTLLEKIEEYEKEVIDHSDYRIAVSIALSDYWRTHFGYKGNDLVIIPCTVNFVFEHLRISVESINAKKQQLGYTENDIIFVYSGSVAGWQSFELLSGFLKTVLSRTADHKILFLSKEDDHITALRAEFPTQVQCRHLSPNEVPETLQVGDYGILIRESSVTNRVASPVKFAEYLACGLKVIISENLGDYSRFTPENNCGFIYTEPYTIEHTSFSEKQRLQKIAQSNFTKSCFSKSYSKLLSL